MLRPITKAFPKLTLNLFLLISVYLILPLFDVPLLGLSISAPLLFLIVLEAIFRPPSPWSNAYRPYITLAILIWVGILLSAIVNGFLSGGTNMDTRVILTVIRYAYWLLIFVVVIYVVNVGNLFLVLTRVLGWSILVLALLRWAEVFIYGNVGAWTGTHLLSQNDYGIQFSIFSPFLLGLAMLEKGGKRIVAIVGYILLLGSVAINGSRGSWVGVAIGLAVLLMVFAGTRPRGFWGLFALLILVAGISFWIFSASSQISQAVSSRFDTLQNLDEEKSYAIRTLMNQKATRLFEQSPVFGVGAGRFTVSSIELDIPLVLQYESQAYFDRKSAHNSYLSFLAENGLVGTIPFAILLLYLTIAGWKAASYFVRQSQYWGAMIYTGFIGMSVHMWVISALTNTSTWFVYGLVAAMIVMKRSVAKESIL